jgi:hypothetical protein
MTTKAPPWLLKLLIRRGLPPKIHTRRSSILEGFVKALFLGYAFGSLASSISLLPNDCLPKFKGIHAKDHPTFLYNVFRSLARLFLWDLFCSSRD